MSVELTPFLTVYGLRQDGNGYIDRHELAIMLRFMGESISEDEIKDIIEEADKDKDGLIDYSEFYSMMCCGKTPASQPTTSTST